MGPSETRLCHSSASPKHRPKLEGKCKRQAFQSPHLPRKVSRRSLLSMERCFHRCPGSTTSFSWVRKAERRSSKSLPQAQQPRSWTLRNGQFGPFSCGRHLRVLWASQPKRHWPSPGLLRKIGQFLVMNPSHYSHQSPYCNYWTAPKVRIAQNAPWGVVVIFGAAEGEISGGAQPKCPETVSKPSTVSQLTPGHGLLK